MKQADLLKVLATELGTADLAELNKLLKTTGPQGTKFRFTGKKIGHFGFTGPIKIIVNEGVKVFDVNKVILLRFDDIESCAKAKPHIERPKRSKIAKEIKPKPLGKVEKIEKEEEGEWATKKQGLKKAPTGSIYTKAKRR